MIRVCCAIIVKNDQILSVQRSISKENGGKWEFPGGKVEDETDEACILREIKEELNINIQIIKKLSPVIHHYNDKSIHLIPFLCEIVSGEIVLHVHKAMKWLGKDSLLSVDWSQADLQLITNGNIILCD